MVKFSVTLVFIIYNLKDIFKRNMHKTSKIQKYIHMNRDFILNLKCHFLDESLLF